MTVRPSADWTSTCLAWSAYSTSPKSNGFNCGGLSTGLSVELKRSSKNAEVIITKLWKVVCTIAKDITTVKVAEPTLTNNGLASSYERSE